MQNLDELRDQIDQIDESILELLEKRAEVATKVGEIKKQMAQSTNSPMAVYVPEREQRVLDRLKKKGGKHFPEQAIESVYREIMSACRAVQKPIRVAFLGPAGTYTNMAAQNTFGLMVDFVDASTVEAVFDAVARGNASFGVVPIENSTEGGVHSTLDQLAMTNLMIHREVVMEVSHCLVSMTENLSQIKRVFSHGQALAQCRSWLAKNLPRAQLIVTNTTTEAAKLALQDGEGSAIASRLAAQLNGLVVVRENIQDQQGNSTRFIVLHTTDAEPTGNDKTSIMFSVNDGAGQLAGALDLIRKHNVNMTRIESRASRNKMWDYVFFIDMQGHRLDLPVAAVLEDMKKVCKIVKLLGSYPNAISPSR